MVVRRRVDRLRSMLCALGAVLTGAGVLILLFVAYQLWGTGLYTARQQDSLRAEFNDRVERIEPAPQPTTSTTADRPAPPPPSGEAVAIITIPRLSLEEAVVHGVGVSDLRKGPGHYPTTPMPGRNGNAAIAGHRTTYGAPFNRLDELSPGDEILITTLEGRYTYRVATIRIVRPEQVEVLDPTPTPTLTLTTCNPKYSAKERLVVAGLDAGQPPPSEPPPGPAPEAGPTPAPEGLVGGSDLGSAHSKWPAVRWGALTALVGAGWWLVVRRHRRWAAWVLPLAPFLVVLFFFYAHLELLLPGNF